MRTRWWLLVAAGLAIALPASAQMMGPMGQGGGMGQMGGGMMGGGMMGHGMGPGMRERQRGRAMSHEGPLITIMLEHTQELGLNPEQERKLRTLRTEFEKESVRRTAEIRVAEIELDSLLEQDRWDLARTEQKVKQIGGLRADLRLARIKTLEAGRTILTPDQLEKLKQVGHRMRSMGGPGQPMGPGGPMGSGMTPGPGMMGPGMMGPGQPMGPGMPGPGGPPAPRQ